MESKALAISGLPNLAYARSRGPLRVTGLLTGNGVWRSARGRATIDEPECPRSAKVTPLDEIKLACDRIICGLITPRVRRGFEPSQARASGAAFNNRRDAPSLYDRPEREFRNLKNTDHFRQRNLRRRRVAASNSERRQSDSQLQPNSATKRPQLLSIYSGGRVVSRDDSDFNP